MTEEKKKEFTRRITQANKTELITILYEMVLEYLDEADEAYDNGDYAAFDMGLTRAEDCINELIHSLHLTYEIAQRFLQLYLFAKRELIRAIARRDAEPVEAVRDMFTRFHDTYRALEKMDLGQPEMKDAQVVYAGLTYGKSDLNESIEDPLNNRGYRA